MEVESTHQKSLKSCVDQDIRHELSVPYTHQHNGLVDKRNRIVLNMVRSMMKQRNVPHWFWDEAVTIAAYVLNR